MLYIIAEKGSNIPYSITRDFGKVDEIIYVDNGDSERLALRVENIIRHNPNNVVIFLTCAPLFTLLTAKRVAKEVGGIVFAAVKLDGVLTLV